MVALRIGQRLSDDDEVSCVLSLTMKYHRIAANLALNQKRTTDMAESYRCLIQ